MTTTPTVPPSAPPPAPPRRSLGRRLLAVAVVLLGGLLLLAGIDGLGRHTTTTTDEVSADGIDVVDVHTRAGAVTVVAVDRDDVLVTSRVRTGWFSRATADVHRDGRALVLESTCGGIETLRCSVDFDMELPRDLAASVVVHSSAGEIDLRGLSGDVEVRTTAGEVRLVGFDGEEAVVSTTAGSIEVVAGPTTRLLDLRTTAGKVDVAIDDTEPLRVDVATTVGSRSVTVQESPDADRVVVARTTAGEVTVAPR